MTPCLVLQLATRPVARLPAGGAALALAPRDAALLAWLALEGPTPRLRLAQLLWPDSSPEQARNALRQRLFQLKRQLGTSPVEGQTTLALAAGVQHDLADAAELLGNEALDLGAEFDAWLAQRREQHRTRARLTLAELAEMAERAGDWPDALAHARELLALAPASEEAHRRVMRLHYLAGDRASALLAFDACERMLKHEVGTRPSAETLALLTTIEQEHAAPAPSPAAARRVPASVLRPPRLVGRADAWQALAQARAAGQEALVSGEGGLGKSRLLNDFAASCGGLVVAGARPGDERTAYASFSRLLRLLPRDAWAALTPPLRRELARLLPELGEAPRPLEGEAERVRFFNAVAALFGPATAAASGVVFDDLHFADDASLELLQFVVAARPGRWLFGARLAEVSPLARRLVDGWLQRPDTVHVPLRPLTLAQVAELVDTLGIAGLAGQEAAPALLRRSGGNPLFLLETLKAGWLPAAPGPVAPVALRGAGAGPGATEAALVPAGAAGGVVPAAPGVHALIERRISRLSLPAVQLARCAAIAAPDFSIELAAHVLALRTIDLADPWAELEAAQVLVDGAFVHDLIYEAALASVPAAVARQLHAEVAAFLAGRDGEPARLAHHWLQAGRWSEAAAACRAAAERAVQSARLAEALALLAEGARCCERAGLADPRFDILLRRARLLADYHYGPEGLAAVAEVQALARTDLQALQAMDVRLALAMNRGESVEALREGRVALAAAQAQGRADLALHFAVVVADALCDERQATEAVALLEPYADAVRSGATVEAQWDYWSGLALALDYADRLRDALPAWEAARAVAAAAGRSDMVWKTLSSAASTLAKLGQVERAAEQNAQACRLAQDIGDVSLRLTEARITWAHRLRDLGQYTPALALLEEALAGPLDGRPAVGLAGAEHRLAQLYQQLGQPARAAPLLADPRPGLPPGLATMRLVHQADLARQLGRDGLPLMRRALAVIHNPDDVYSRIAGLFATRMVPPDEGEALATSLAAWAGVRERQGLALAGHVRAAACALALGASRRAQPHAEAALHLARDRQPDSFYLPELWLVAGRVEAALGHAAAARHLWQQGVAWVRRVADSQVPGGFRESFLHRNEINAALLAAVAAG